MQAWGYVDTLIKAASTFPIYLYFHHHLYCITILYYYNNTHRLSFTCRFSYATLQQNNSEGE